MKTQLSIASVVCILVGATSPVSAAPASDAARPSYREVTVRLEGALPNTNPKLQDDLAVFLGRTPDGQWRPWVMGYSGFIDDSTGRVHKYKLYNWIDDEGKLTSVSEDGRTIELAVEMIIHSDPWVAGGTLQAKLRLRRHADGSLSGTYDGKFERPSQSAAGPAGSFDIAGKAQGRIDAAPWPSPVDGWKRVSPGEHPRLLFRKSDVPALRARMKTPLGRFILARLEHRLASDDKSEDSWRGYGYGLMYQLTGDKTWADKGRSFCEAVIADKLQSPRYGWQTRDGGYMRIGPTAAAVAATYDMCFDAWDRDFRQWAAGKLQERIWPNMAISPDRSESDAQYSPRSNHYLLWNGGAGYATLAILGDPGVDDAKMIRAHRIFQQRLKRGLTDGYGDHGWFYEGTFCGRFPANIAATQYIQALRVARGMDYVTNSSEARWLVTRWLYEAVRSGGKVRYHPRGMYDRIDDWQHFNGDFALGFGILPNQHRAPAMWFCRKVLHPNQEFAVDATGVRELVYAYINWPDELEGRDPTTVLGRTLYDREAKFFVFRSGWKGERDIVVTMYADTKVLGMGLRTDFPMGIPVGPDMEVTHFNERDDGVTTVTAHRDGPGDETSDYHFLADFSGLCGSNALLVGLLPDTGQRSVEEAVSDMTPEQRAKLEAILRDLKGGETEKSAKSNRLPDQAGADHHKLSFHGRTACVMTVQEGPGPEVAVSGEGDAAAIVVGQRRITFNGEQFIVGRNEN